MSRFKSLCAKVKSPLAILLVLALCFALLPMAACAAETEDDVRSETVFDLENADAVDVAALEDDAENTAPEGADSAVDAAPAGVDAADESAPAVAETARMDERVPSDSLDVEMEPAGTVSDEMESPDRAENPAPDAEDLLPDIEAEDSIAEAAALATNDSTPVIALTYVPAYGENSLLSGVVFYEDGSALDNKAYNISVYIQTVQGGQAYPKPYDDQRCTEIGANGVFHALFITDGAANNDPKAVTIHVLLVPANYTPGSLSDTEAHAVDHVVIQRSPDGGISVSPARTAPVVNTTTVLPVSADKLAVNIGFHIDGTWPDTGLSESLIRKQLDAVAGFANVVRFYSSGGETKQAYKIAHDMGLSVVGTAELKSGEDSANLAELDALIDNCNKGYVQVACVGNETMLEGDLTEAKLIEYIGYVRDRVTDPSIPVTTSDTLGELLDRPALRDACDILFPNVYPYWGGTAIGAAALDLSTQLGTLATVSGGKQIIVSETGWPDQGGSHGSAVASGANVTTYFDAVRQWSLDNGVQVLWFSGADEPWKAGTESDVGAHWGIFTKDLALKDCYAKTAFFRSRVRSLSAAAVTVANQTCTGKTLTPAVKVVLNGTELKQGRDYSVKYANNTNIGTATVTVTGVGLYTGTAKGSFAIKGADPALSVSAGSKLMVGQSLTVKASAKADITYKSSNTGIATVSSKGVVKGIGPGTVTITVQAGGGTYATVKKTVKVAVSCKTPVISKAVNVKGGVRLTWGKSAGAAKYRVYCKTGSGSWKSVGVTAANSFTVKTGDGKNALKHNTKYTFTVKCVASNGSTATSDYSKSGKSLLYLAAPDLSKVTGSGARVTVSWKKRTGASGYQVQYSTSKSFSGGKTVTVKGGGTLSKRIESLTRGKVWYVRVRCYQSGSGGSVYSGWSAAGSVKLAK